MRTFTASGVGLFLSCFVMACSVLAFPALAAAPAMHQFDDLALSSDGTQTATIESDDPGNLKDEPHGAVVGRNTSGAVVAHYDPCAVCRYSDPAWSPHGDVLVFLATDD